MKKILQWCLSLPLCAMSAGSHAQTTPGSTFYSLHQQPRSVAISSGSDGVPVYSTPERGFEMQYAPQGVTGCGVGIQSLSSLCQLGNGLSAFFPGYSSYREIKTYVPAGTLTFAVSGFMPQSASFVVAARMGQPPARVEGVSREEYELLKTQNPNLVFSKLMAGEEAVLVHDGSGSIILSGNGVMQRWPTVKGAWLYMRVLEGDELYNLQYQSKVDGDEYVRWYEAHQASNGFDAQTKDPKETSFTPQAPTGIRLLPAVLNPNSAALIRPSNASAMVIGECTLRAKESGATLSGVSINNYTISVGPGAPDQTVVVSCGNAADASSIYAPVTPVFSAELRVCATCPAEPVESGGSTGAGWPEFAQLSSNFRQTYNPQTLTPSFGRYAIPYGDNGAFGKKIKMFMPPGTVMMTSRFINNQSGIPKAVWRFSSPPQRTATSVAEGERPIQFGAELLAFLQQGTADIAFSGYQGGISLTDGGVPIATVPQRGAYVYVDMDYNSHPSFDTTMYVDKACYDSWYANAEWDANGNPVEAATHTCAGSGTGTTPGGDPGGVPDPGGNPGGGTALSGIVVSQTELVVGSGQTSVMVGSVPDVATLPACSVSPQGVLEKDELLSEVTLGRAQTWRLMPTANVGTSVTVMFNCGGRTASVRVLGLGGSPGGGSNPNPGGGTGTTPGGPAGEATVTSQVVSGQGQPVVVRAVLTRPVSAVGAEGALSYWVGARIEAGSPGFEREAWFFLTPQGWMPMSSPNREQVAYRTAVVATGRETLELGLGVLQEQAAAYRLQVFLGYAGADHVFRNMGVVWDPLQ